MCANVFQHGGKFNRSNAQVDLAVMSCAQASNILDSVLTTICKRYYVMNLRVGKTIDGIKSRMRTFLNLETMWRTHARNSNNA